MLIKIHKKKGFTLLELIIVIAIIAILSAIGAPTFSSYMATRRLNGAARQVQSDLFAARMRAISDNKLVAVSFINNNQYTIFFDNNNNGSIDSGETIVTKSIHPTYHDVTISAVSSYQPKFYSKGTSNNGRITFTGSTGTKEIVVNPVGRAKIN